MNIGTHCNQWSQYLVLKLHKCNKGTYCGWTKSTSHHLGVGRGKCCKQMLANRLMLANLLAGVCVCVFYQLPCHNCFFRCSKSAWYCPKSSGWGVLAASACFFGQDIQNLKYGIPQVPDLYCFLLNPPPTPPSTLRTPPTRNFHPTPNSMHLQFLLYVQSWDKN